MRTNEEGRPTLAGSNSLASSSASDGRLRLGGADMLGVGGVESDAGHHVSVLLLQCSVI